MKWTTFIPVIGQLVDLGFSIADRVRARRAKRKAAQCPPEKGKR